MVADDYIGDSTSDSKARKIYALCSLRRVGSAEVSPLQDATQYLRTVEHFEGTQGLARLNKLTREFMRFMVEISAEENGAIVEPQAKKKPKAA